SLPAVFHEIVRVMNDPLSSAAHIAEVISRDTSLSSRMLRLVNSSFYSFMSRIDTLSRAVTIVGTVEITNLAMGISVISRFRDIPEELVDMRGFWEHSIAAGVIARILATRTKHPGLEQVFVGGLLHDLGRLVLIRHYPEICAAMFEYSTARPSALQDLEKQVLGYHHASLGAGLLREWKIPASLQSMVGGHHDLLPEAADPALLIHIADILSHALGLGSSGSRRVPRINPGIWEKTGLPLSTLPSLVSQAENQIRDLMRIIVQENGHAG
ncbi:MAG: HDOD domain-containing protein, partial [Desulfonatronovibrionaceae bacterium]